MLAISDVIEQPAVHSCVLRVVANEMKIALVGGGSGGHFYPLIAVVERIHDIIEERKLLAPELLYIGPTPFDAQALIEQNITHIYAPAGKIRRHGGIKNFFDLFKTFGGIVSATTRLFSIYPDVVFSTGGYAAFPTLFAARLLRIPVIIYDADSQPGRTSRYSAKFARHIAIAHPDAADGFPKETRDKIALVGHPIRKEIQTPAKEGGHEFLDLDPSVPTIFVLGGSQGAETINNVILEALEQLVQKYNIVHQTGKEHLDGVKGVANTILRNTKYESRYRAFGLLNTFAIRMVAGISSLVISRAGSGTIFEIAAWGIPSIMVPIPGDISHDQERNAFAYARVGAAIVIKQANLTPNLLMAELDRLMEDEEERKRMAEATSAYARHEGAKKIAGIIVETALEHTN